MDFDYNITDDINECKIQKGMLLQPAMNSAYCEQCLVLGKQATKRRLRSRAF